MHSWFLLKGWKMRSGGTEEVGNAMIEERVGFSSLLGLLAKIKWRVNFPTPKYAYLGAIG